MSTRPGSEDSTPASGAASTQTFGSQRSIHARSEVHWQREASVWQTLTLGELQRHGLLSGLLGTPQLWPDAAEAALRPNPRVFWPGKLSPKERTATWAALHAGEMGDGLEGGEYDAEDAEGGEDGGAEEGEDAP